MSPARLCIKIVRLPAVVSFGLSLLALSLGNSVTSAQSVRPPLASGRSAQSERDFSQAPKELGSFGIIVDGTPNDAVRIVNLGNSKLAISYWDGMGDWHDITISPAAYDDIQCAKCNGNINVVFNNGRTDKAIRTAIGNAYQLYWSNEQQTWNIEVLHRQ